MIMKGLTLTYCILNISHKIYTIIPTRICIGDYRYKKKRDANVLFAL